MRPTQFNSYIRRSDGNEFRFIGYAQLLHEDETSIDVCILAPVCSGFQMAAAEFKRTPEHTLYFIVEPDEFSALFDEGSPAPTRNTEGVVS